MHRSGTSFLTGLIHKMGFNIGNELQSPCDDNESGYFERVDVFIENEIMLYDQSASVFYNTYHYSNTDAIKTILEDSNETSEYRASALQFFNNKLNYPWVLKDPRLCITLKTWLYFLETVPAVVFTYR